MENQVQVQEDILQVVAVELNKIQELTQVVLVVVVMVNLVLVVLDVMELLIWEVVLEVVIQQVALV
jgi:hypothetical protein